MMHSQDQLKRFSYSGGREYVDKLKSILNENSDSGLARRLGIPKGTITTWLQRNTTPYEISIIVHLNTGLSLSWLLLDEGEPFEHQTNADSGSSLVEFDKEELSNGELKTDGTVSFDQRFLDSYDIDKDNAQLIAQDDQLFFVNTQETMPMSGTYLINLDGGLSLNRIQRLPKKKLAISFGDSIIEIIESDISVLGRVAMTVNKE
ncbi:TPA: helix-turn-helix domain-containing protein [Photobacterium damselae]